MNRRDSIAAILAAVLWGFNLVAGKIGVGLVPPFLFSGLRFLIVAAIIVPFFPVARQHWRDLFILSVCFGTGHFGLLFLGLAGVDSATAAITLQLGVPFAIIVSWLVFGEKFGWRRSTGLVLAFLGIAYLAGEPRHASFTAFLALVVCTLFWAWSNVLVKRLTAVNAFAITGWLSLFAAPQLLLLSLVFETDQLPAVQSGGWPLVATLVYTAVAASIVAHGTWYKLIQRYPLNTVVPYSMLIPIVGITAGLLFLNEPLTVQKVVGGTFTLVGVAIIQWRNTFQSGHR